jgi:hypothetical protein
MHGRTTIKIVVTDVPHCRYWRYTYQRTACHVPSLASIWIFLEMPSFMFARFELFYRVLGTASVECILKVSLCDHVEHTWDPLSPECGAYHHNREKASLHRGWNPETSRYAHLNTREEWRQGSMHRIPRRTICRWHQLTVQPLFCLMSLWGLKLAWPLWPKLSSPSVNRSRSSSAERRPWIAQVGEWLSCVLDDKYRGSNPGKGTVLFFHRMVVCSGAYPASSPETNGGFLRGSDHSPPSGTEVKYAWSRNSTCPYIIINGWLAFVAAAASVVS